LRFALGSSESPAHPQSAETFSMKKVFLLLLFFAALAAAGGGYWWYHRQAGSSGTLTLYGNVDIRQVALAFDGSGRISELAVEEGDVVKGGDVIGRLDTEQSRIAANLVDDIAALKRTAAEELAPVMREHDELLLGLKIYCEANRAKLTRNFVTKTVQFPTGRVCWRARPAAVPCGPGEGEGR